MAILHAPAGTPTPPGMERVTVSITATADFDVFMPAGEADGVDENDPRFVQDVVATKGDDLVNDLDFEVGILHIAGPAKKRGAG